MGAVGICRYKCRHESALDLMMFWNKLVKMKITINS
jgi:hypothetical protein